MMPEFQLKITDLYNIPIGNITKLLPNFFDKDKCVLQYENLQLCLRLGLKLKKTIQYVHQNQVISHTKYFTII